MSSRLKRIRIPPRTRYQRPVLTDVLPFEVPPSFSNGGFFYFLSKYNVRILKKGDETWVIWEANGSIADTAISAIFNTADKNSSNFLLAKKVLDGKVIRTRQWKLKSSWTQPYHFRISHKETEFRQLSIPHPANQVFVADFYDRHGALIVYECNKSSFSIRKPAAIAKTARFKDRLFSERLSQNADAVEQSDAEYQSIGSYFTYDAYSNIFRFYENRVYHNAEKKFGRLLKLDISSCFDNIYTHSIVWSVLGHEVAKQDLGVTKGTFGGTFDSLMQHMNRGETNGILIGPEFSRIFAEVLLQEVDYRLEAALLSEHDLRNKVDYEIFRYVDDYFVFSNDAFTEELIRGHLGAYLKDIKLGLNKEKSEAFERPIVTALTIAKNRVSYILKERVSINERLVEDPDDPTKEIKFFSINCQSNALIVDFKTALAETGVTYKDILNYTLATIERKIEKIFHLYGRNHHEHKNERELTRCLTGLFDFSFFVYAASPRVNFTIRLTRIICAVVDGLHQANIDRDLKDHVLKFIFDNILRQIKNSPFDRFREVETLYLLLAVGKLGRSYVLPEKTLARFLAIDWDNTTGYHRARRMSYFSITVCLLMIKNRTRYRKLKQFLEEEIDRKYRERSAYLNSDAELLIGFLDLQCCPYVSAKLKLGLASRYGYGVFEVLYLSNVTTHWFTNWEAFDLSFELDKKRAREVY